ncbi:extensin family protein [Shimia abyssi]|nr:extensin family protein [Shimia abyssi]
MAAALCVGLGVAGFVEARAPEKSLRPVTREHVFPPALSSFAPDASLRPVVRPQNVTRKVSSAVAAASTAAVLPKPEPEAKPEKKKRDWSLRAKRKDGLVRLCKDRKLYGEEIKPVMSNVRGCGIPRDAIRLHEVNGVNLSRPATIKCDTARALQLWVDKGLEPAVGRYGGGVAELKVVASYACRTRNNRPGAKISEHGKGNAIDIAAVHLKNGDSISVLRDWNKGKKGRILKKAHSKACGPFGTVLGPNSDRYHRDHFHFDIARHRGGSYCR